MLKVKVKSLSPYLIPWDSMDCILPGSSLHVIFQARILQRVAIFFSRGSSGPRDQTGVSHIQADSLLSEQPENLFHVLIYG